MTACAAVISILLFCPALSDSSLQMEARTATAPEESEAIITSLAWIAGHWQGTGLGNEVDEAWLPPAGGALSGIFRMIKDDKILFYETMVIREIEGRMMLRLKHFSETLIGWEEKTETLDFIYVRREGNRWLFKGLVIEKVDDETMVISVDLKSGDRLETVPFSFRRVS